MVLVDSNDFDIVCDLSTLFLLITTGVELMEGLGLAG